MMIGLCWFVTLELRIEILFLVLCIKLLKWTKELMCFSQECLIEEALILEVSDATKDESIDTAYEARETRSLVSPVSYTHHHYQYQKEQQQHWQNQQSVVVGRGDTGIGSGSYSPYPPNSQLQLPPPGPRSEGDGCDVSALSCCDSHRDSLNGKCRIFTYPFSWCHCHP